MDIDKILQSIFAFTVARRAANFILIECIGFLYLKCALQKSSIFIQFLPLTLNNILLYVKIRDRLRFADHHS